MTEKDKPPDAEFGPLETYRSRKANIKYQRFLFASAWHLVIELATLGTNSLLHYFVYFNRCWLPGHYSRKSSVGTFSVLSQWIRIGDDVVSKRKNLLSKAIERGRSLPLYSF